MLAHLRPILAGRSCKFRDLLHKTLLFIIQFVSGPSHTHNNMRYKDYTVTGMEKAWNEGRGPVIETVAIAGVLTMMQDAEGQNSFR